MRPLALLGGRHLRSGILAAVVGIGALSAPGGFNHATGASPGFLPHRAVYELSLGKSRGDGSVTRAQGKLEFEWADVCHGWTVSQRTRVTMATAEGRTFEFGWTLNSLESRNGRDYRFFIRRVNADGSTEEVNGKAHLEKPGGAGVAVFNQPEEREIALPKGTLFPTAHSLLLMEAARRGELPLWRTVFDGSGEDGRFAINAALSQSLSGDVPSHSDSPLLRGRESWRLDLAYFNLDEMVAEPEHEQSLRIYDNGVVDELLLDYGDFVLRADLGVLEALPEVHCPPE